MHADTQYHKASVIFADNFMACRAKSANEIINQLNKAAYDQLQKMKRVLLPIVKTVIFCGQQGLALRGHNESGSILPSMTTSACTDATAAEHCNDGNFRALLRFRIDAGDADLHAHLLNAPKNAQYTSPSIQNDIISCAGKILLSQIVKQINAAKCFAVLADETTDSGRKEQLSVCVRYVHVAEDGKPQLREDFIGFLDVSDDVTAAGLAASILTVLENAGINMAYCYGQGYDGACTMRGHLNGVQKIIRNTYPLALYTHCASHSLNLVLNKACSVPIVRNALGTVSEVATFFSNSAQRTRRPEIVVSEMQERGDLPIQRLHRLKHLCETRWVERHEALTALIDLFPAVIYCLTDMQNEGNAATSKAAASLLHGLASSATLVGLTVAEHVSMLLLPLTSSLQAISIDLVACCTEVDSLVAVLRRYRESNCKFAEIFSKTERLAKMLDLELKVPRTTSRQLNRCNVVAPAATETTLPSTPSAEAENYFRIAVFNPFIDFMLSELNDRFTCHRSNAFTLQVLIPKYTNANGRPAPDLQGIIDVYGTRLPGGESELQAEFLLWQARWAGVTNLSSNALAALTQCPDHYPNIKFLLQILATLPVTTASAERTFSMLRRLKTWLRSTMGEQRLTGLALLASCRDITLTPEAVVECFCEANRRI